MFERRPPEVSAGLANVSPSAPEIGQRSHTRPPPLTGCRAEYLDAETGNGVTRLASPSTSTVTVPPPEPSAWEVPPKAAAPSDTTAATGSSPPAAGRPSGDSANGEGVADDSGTR